jgi:predicted permease
MPEWGEDIRPRLAPLQLKATREAEIVEELSTHLSQRYEELRADGASDEEARRLTLEELHGPELLAHYMQGLRQSHVPPSIVPGAPPVSFVADLRQDLRYAARLLRRQPGFALTAVLTLALGIGASTAMFSLLDAAWLRALPFPDPDRLVAIWAEAPNRPSGGTGFPPANADIAEWRRHTDSFTSIAAFSPGTADLTDAAGAERIGAAGVTAGFFETLGVAPVVGRTLALDEDVPGAPPVVLIGHGLWQRRFGGDPAIVGKPVSINGASRTVIGVLPADFDFPRGAEWLAFFPSAGRTELWLPLAFRPRDDGTGWSNWESRHERGLMVIGRVRPGAGSRQAQAEMDVFAARRARDHPDTHKDTTVRLVPLRDQLAAHSSKPLLILSGAVALLLLIACGNVANLLIARGVSRERETAVRVALGARRGRLIRQLLAECLLLGLLASGLGLAIAYACLRVFLVLNPLGYSRLHEASLDPAALGFAVVMSLVTSVVFGLVPALQSAHFDVRGFLRESRGGGDVNVRERVRAALVASEVALALVLLTTAGLMVRSFLRVQAVETGFRSDGVLVFDLQLPRSYPSEASQVFLFDQLTARLDALPAVHAAGAISFLPLGGGQNRGRFAIEGDPPAAPGHEPSAERRIVTPGYFAAMGIPIRRGRVFTGYDTRDQPRVVVINETMASQYFRDRDPIGRRLTAGGRVRTVIGVVSDVKSSALESDVPPQLYVPHAQWAWAGMSVVLHTEGNTLTHVSAVRAELKALDPDLAAANIRTMTQVVSKATSARRFNTALVVFFSVAALILTMIGIYGVVAFLVGRRSHEFGIRMALGAQRADILRLVLGQGMTPVALGALGGLAGSIAASRFLASQLYGVSPTDPLTFITIVGLLGSAALLACLLPARRATKVAPVEALRGD